MQSFLKLEDVQKEIEEILKTATGEKINICYQIYKKIIQCQGYEAELLCYFFENSEQVESDGSYCVENKIENEEKYQYADKYGEYIDGILKTLLMSSYKKEKFYKKLWEQISESTLLDNEKLKVFAIYYIWIDARVPYFELSSGIKMSGDQYREIRKRILREIQKSRFILSVPVDQKTERASRLVELLDSMMNQEEKAVLMAQILLLWEQKNEN